MTKGDMIRNMNDFELAHFLSRCIIPDDPGEEMIIPGVGKFIYEDDLMDALNEEI